jgi:hypothetical protein
LVRATLPEGVAVPANAAAGRKWKFQFQVRDPGDHQRKRIGENGYFMCKVHPDNAGVIRATVCPTTNVEVDFTSMSMLVCKPTKALF